MKSIIFYIALVIVLIVFCALQLKAQNSIQVMATAEVIEGLSTRETAQMDFGRFSPETQGGKIILSPDGSRTAEGTVVLAGGTHNAAVFYITGQYEATFSITLPSGPELLTNIGNDKTMMVTDWQSSPAQGLGVGKLVGGGMSVRIGASLIVGDMNANPVGMYAGSYAVTFAYN